MHMMAATFTITTTAVTTRITTTVAVAMVVEAAGTALSALCQMVLDVTKMVFSIFLYGRSRVVNGSAFFYVVRPKPMNVFHMEGKDVHQNIFRCINGMFFSRISHSKHLY